MQLELGIDTHEERLSRKCETLEKQIDRLRKSQFALLNELKKITTENKNEIEFLKSYICREKIFFSC